MTIDYWEEMSEAEIKNIPKMEIISQSSAFHIEEISTGNLIVSEKFKETITL